MHEVFERYCFDPVFNRKRFGYRCHDWGNLAAKLQSDGAGNGCNRVKRDDR
jgi:hypothetical protein